MQAGPQTRAKPQTQERPPLSGRPYCTRCAVLARRDYLLAGAAALAAAEAESAAEEAAMAASDAADEAAMALEAAADASDAAASAEAVAASVLLAGPLQATTERAATAAPATRILRRTSEVIVPGPLEGGCCAGRQDAHMAADFLRSTPVATLACAKADYA